MYNYRKNKNAKVILNIINIRFLLLFIKLYTHIYAIYEMNTVLKLK